MGSCAPRRSGELTPGQRKHRRPQPESALWHHSFLKQVVALAAALALGAGLVGCSSATSVPKIPRSQSSSTDVAPSVSTSPATAAATMEPTNPATATSRVSRPPVVLADDGVVSVRFGESTSSAIAGLRQVLGDPSKGPISEAGNCNIDAAEQWPSLTAFLDMGEFVGYSTLAANGEPLKQGNMQTALGLRVGDTIAQAQQIYGSAFQTSLAQGGSWSVTTPDGKLIGYLSGEPSRPGPSPMIASIEAGSVGCPAATP